MKKGLWVLIGIIFFVGAVSDTMAKTKWDERTAGTFRSQRMRAGEIGAGG